MGNFQFVSIAGDPDLDSLLDCLCKVKEETAAAIAVQDPRRPTIIARQNRPLAEEEFDSFMQKSDVVHVPTSFPICYSARLSRRKSLAPEGEHGRPSIFHNNEHFNLPRPSSVTTPQSPSHVCHISKEFNVCTQSECIIRQYITMINHTCSYVYHDIVPHNLMLCSHYLRVIP